MLRCRSWELATIKDGSILLFLELFVFQMMNVVHIHCRTCGRCMKHTQKGLETLLLRENPIDV